NAAQALAGPPKRAFPGLAANRGLGYHTPATTRGPCSTTSLMRQDISPQAAKPASLQQLKLRTIKTALQVFNRLITNGAAL
ncbi:MAG: hypothetical protein M1337_08480, partial [Actinobacteria bacterium]|nr:hypothetical protein [Actinomycetota bacterium]